MQDAKGIAINEARTSVYLSSEKQTDTLFNKENSYAGTIRIR